MFLISRPQMWPSGLTLAMTLTLNLQGQTWNFLYLSQKWPDCHKTKSKHISIEIKASNVTIGFDLGHDLDFEFSRSNMEFAMSQLKVVRRTGVRIYQITTGVTWDVGVPSTHCPACRTSLIATRFWVVMICPIIKCLIVLEFSFILFDLCLFITIFNFILNYVPIVTFWILTYHKILILLIIFCFIWSYWIIYFLTCLEVFWSVVS